MSARRDRKRDESLIDECRRYQARYRRGDESALGLLYQAVVELARPICWSLARCSVSRERVEQIAHDCATRLIERYLRHSDYQVRSFGAAIRLEVIHAMTEGGHGERPTRRYIERALALSPDIEARLAVKAGNPASYLRDLLDDHKRGADIVLAVVHATTYPKAIRAVREIASKQWIYDHAVKLRYVWKLTRRRREKNRSDDDRRRGSGRGEAAVQALRTDIQRRGAGAAPRIHHDRGGS